MKNERETREQDISNGFDEYHTAPEDKTLRFIASTLDQPYKSFKQGQNDLALSHKQDALDFDQDLSGAAAQSQDTRLTSKR